MGNGTASAKPADAAIARDHAEALGLAQHRRGLDVDGIVGSLAGARARLAGAYQHTVLVEADAFDGFRPASCRESRTTDRTSCRQGNLYQPGCKAGWCPKHRAPAALRCATNSDPGLFLPHMFSSNFCAEHRRRQGAERSDIKNTAKSNPTSHDYFLSFAGWRWKRHAVEVTCHAPFGCTASSIAFHDQQIVVVPLDAGSAFLR